MTDEIAETGGEIQEMFTFGDPEAVNLADLWGNASTVEDDGEIYLPPISFASLAKMRRANGHHGSCITFRSYMLLNAYKGGGLSRKDMARLATDLLTFGNGFVELIPNTFGKIVELKHIPAINMRVRTKKRGFRQLLDNDRHIDFHVGRCAQIAQYDTLQQVYGQCDWVGGIQSALLNQDATLFRRRYYVNGAHMGYILYSNDAKLSKELQKKIADQVKQGKGLGNFKSAYFHIPNGQEKAFQIIPIGDISQKDEFLNIKNVSAADVREAHRVPPVLMGIVPQGTSSLGDPKKVEEVYMRTEVRGVAQNFLALNDSLPSGLQLKFNFDVPKETE